MTTAQRESALDRVLSRTDRDLVDDCDTALLLKLEALWWADHVGTFAEAFQSACSPDEWEGIARTKRAELETYLADEIRDMYRARTLPLPDEYEDEDGV